MLDKPCQKQTEPSRDRNRRKQEAEDDRKPWWKRSGKLGKWRGKREEKIGKRRESARKIRESPRKNEKGSGKLGKTPERFTDKPDKSHEHARLDDRRISQRHQNRQRAISLKSSDWKTRGRPSESEWKVAENQ